MQIRGDISYDAFRYYQHESLVMDNDGGVPYTDEWLHHDAEHFNPDNAAELEAIRAHCIEHPEGVLLDAYQAVTELGLKEPSGSPELQARLLKGLRGEVRELHQELLKAQAEHPYMNIIQSLDEIDDFWVATVLDPSRLRFNHLSPERKAHYLSELGDVLWYTSRLAHEGGISLSEAVLQFMLRIGAGDLQARVDRGDSEGLRQRFAETLDFELFQVVALSLDERVAESINQGMPVERRVKVENMPSMMLSIIDYEYLWGDERSESDELRVQINDFEVTIGRLVWFVAYTAHSILNTDFRTVMQANLQKLISRSRRGTLFEKIERTEADEAETIVPDLRMPVSIRPVR